MRTVILITGHYLHSKRRAGFHWIAEALHARRWRVIMMTAPISWLSWLKRDHRMQYDLRREAGRIIWTDDRLGSYVWWTSVHPVSLKFGPLNHAARLVFDRFEQQPLGAIEPEVRTADCFIFESTPALVLAERFRSLNPRARMVYRVSDDLNTLRVHPTLHAREMQLAPLFDRISSPTQSIHDKFAHLAAAHLDRHGVPTLHFEQCDTTPYSDGRRSNAVFVGVARLDHWFIDTVSGARPAIRFHIIGPFDPKTSRDNVNHHGELSFEHTVPYLKFADVGLQTITGGTGAESFADSLKMMQYSWCRLPIVAPDFIETTRDNVVTYTPGNVQSAVAAMDRALLLQRTGDWRRGIQAWHVVAAMLVGEPHADRHAPSIETLPDAARARSVS